MLKRSNSYSYSYGRKSNKNLKIFGIIGLVVVIVAAVVFLNFNRIRALVKGYNFTQANQIVAMESEAENEILASDFMEHFDTWHDLEATPVNYDDYERYYELFQDYQPSEIVSYVDELNGEIYSQLEELGFDQDGIWAMVGNNASISDFEYLIDNNLTATKIAPYLEVDGYMVKNMKAYIEADKTNNNPTYTVGVTNYPFILSTTAYSGRGYTITNPDEILTLVKAGFYLENSYEPSDLVEAPMPIAPDCGNPLVRQVVADALQQMYEDAKAEGLSLVFNSGYRSYTVQAQTYQDFETRYGGLYASQYVALPGASEHQTGLGVDLTSQSVVDGTRITFGDTAEYKWVLANAAKYGFINRYPESTSDLTGIAHEPWHFRYVGVEVAQEITDANITFEQYCLENGILPTVVAR